MKTSKTEQTGMMASRARIGIALAITLLACWPVQSAVFICDPAKGRPDGDGSEASPWRSLEEVIAAKKIQFRNAGGQPSNAAGVVKPGDTVLLRSGWHGVVRIPGGFNNEFITIAAAPGQFPQVGWVDIGGGTKWRIKGLTVSPSLAPSPMNKVPPSLVMLGEHGDESSCELVVEDCFIYSVLEAKDWSAGDWDKKPANGIWLGRHGKGHIARNNYVLNTRFGINLCAPEVLCEGNVVVNFSGDGIRATRDGQVVQYNIIRNNFVGAKDGDDNHDDGIQVFLFNKGTGTVRDIVLRGNLIIARDRDGLPYPNPLQGIGCFDGPLVHFTVEKNVVLVNQYHGISLYDAQECVIRGNACYSRWTADRAKPWIMLGQKHNQARGNIVTNNLAHSFGFKADKDATTNDNNVISEKVFEQRCKELAAQIDEKFGKTHPAAQRSRLD